MNFQNFRLQIVGTVLIVILGMAAFVAGQGMPIAGANNMYCAGYVQKDNVDTSFQIVGADDEKERNHFAHGDYLYISQGAGGGLQVGDMYSVIRPRGRVLTRWTSKRNLGIYVQEVGAVEIIRVRNNVAIAQVKTSCDNIMMGDLLERMPQRTSPVFEKRPPLDIFSTSSGKTRGQIFMARDGQEMITAEQIVYIDLGREDNVNVGDYLTIFRPLGTGNILDDLPYQPADARESGFQSEEYRGGRFSNQSGRKKGSNAGGSVVEGQDIRENRGLSLRKVVGELVILNVRERTATAVIVRTTGEIHTGDNVELQ